MMELENLRREYLQGGLRRADLDGNPLAQFEKWMKQAVNLQIQDSTAMVAATVDADGQPSQRMVLLKHLDENGFVFFTNFGSRKARELEGNPQISLLFPWNAMDRQVKICGTAEKVSSAQSLKYFLSRSRESQLAAWSSKQSHAIASRDFLLNQLQRMKQKFADGDIPLPDFWGGVRVRPRQIEFWQGGEHRLHDRFEYNLQANGSWTIQRLAP